MRVRGVDLRLVLPALAGWLTAGLIVAAPQLAWRVCAAACLAAVAIGSWALWRPSRTVGAGARAAGGADAAVRVRAAGAAGGRAGAGAAIVVLSAIALSAAATGPSSASRHPDGLDRLAAGHAVVADAVVTTSARAAAGSPFRGAARVSFRVVTRSVTAGRDEVVGRMPALVYAPAARELPRLGEQLRIRATAKTTPAGDDVSLMLYATDVTRTASAPAWEAWANTLRSRFLSASARLPGDGGALLPGLAIGDESRVSAELDGQMKSSSLSHLTAVSGSNCAVIVGGVLALAGAAGFSRRARIATALAALAAFVVLVTPGASVLRAAVMASIVVLGTALGRPGRAVPALALAVIVLLAHDPWLSRDYGFALSVLATTALLVLARPLAEKLQRALPRWLAVGLSVPLAAQLACQPVLVLLNPTVPLYGVVANVLAEPAAPIATVVGLIGCLVVPLSAQLASPLLWAAWAPAAWIAGVARTSTELPASALPWPTGLLGFGLAVLLTGAVVVLVTRPRTVRGRFVRAALGGASVLLLLVVTALQAGPAIAAKAAMPRDWVVGLCDVGQGDAIVVKSGDQYGLIDTGPEPKALSACLRQLGIRQLALLVLTHYDLDHVGGVDAVVGKAGFALVGHPDDAVAERKLASLRRGGAQVHQATRGDSGALGALRWRVLWPDGAHPDMSTGNEGGVTLEIADADVRMIFLADLDARAQDALISDGGVPHVDIVKVAHHGSADQSTRLYGLLHARLGLISCGLGNDYGHPRGTALALLRAAGTQVARTDLEGTVLVTAHAGELGLWTETHASDAALWTPAR